MITTPTPITTEVILNIIEDNNLLPLLDFIGRRNEMVMLVFFGSISLFFSHY